MEPTTDELFELLGSDLNRRILTLTSEEECGADAIAECCEASLPTVYRHIDDLRSAGLLDERVAYDADGNHYKIYRPSLETVTVRLADGDIRLTVEPSSIEEEAVPTADPERLD